tara:strand:- start:132 stop:584 length:453 start_codon:yes stop_codon:yes gene_type:complete
MDWCVLYGRSKKNISLINIERATMQTQEKQIVKFMNHKVDPTYIWHTAKDAAVKAVDEYMKDKEEPMYCGFANVKVRPAKGKFVNFLKRQGIGDIAYKGGWRISYYDIMPKSHPWRMTQSMSIKEIGCDAFAKVLEEQFGLDCISESRAD